MPEQDSGAGQLAQAEKILDVILAANILKEFSPDLDRIFSRQHTRPRLFDIN